MDLSRDRIPQSLHPEFGLDEVVLHLPGRDRRLAGVVAVLAMALLLGGLGVAAGTWLHHGFQALDAPPSEPVGLVWRSGLLPALAVMVPGLPLGLWLGWPPPRLALSPTGIAVGEETLRWGDILDAEAHDHSVVLYRDGEPVRIPTGRGSRSTAVPLAALCRELAREASGQAPAELADLRAPGQRAARQAKRQTEG